MDQIEQIEVQVRASRAAADPWQSLADGGFRRRSLATPVDAELDRIEDFSRAVSAALTQCRTAISERLAADVRARLGELSGALGGVDAINVSALSDREVASRREFDRSEQTANVRGEELLGLVGRTGERSAELAERVMKAVSNGADQYTWLELARDINDAARAQTDRVAREGLADEMRALIARIDDEQVAADLTARVDAAASRSFLEARRSEILAAITKAEEDSERRYILEQAAEVWRELGYEVDTGFAEVALTGEAALLHRSDWPSHALQVRFPAGRSEIATNVVALDETSTTRDREVEEEHCVNVAEFSDELANRGVEATLRRSNPPGARPVQKRFAPTAARRSRLPEQKRTLG
ncbi:hypothetical protein ACIGKQ_21140 [Gordonia sp. NPDC062954]|uniref:hypothetical protein n=1 Tax=Gordonia sp. NPDC062954 TaxID=3364003 RepID=UPI0037C5B6F3